MSKMRSVNSAGLLACLAAAVLLHGCGRVDVNSPQIRGIAYVRINDVVKHHPLYGQLSQINDAIAAIDLEAAGPNVPRSAAEIASQTKVLNAELVAAQERANKTIAAAQAQYGAREQQAIAAALAAAGISGGPQVGAQVNAQSAAQSRAAVQAASSDFLAYERSVVAQSNAASNAIVQQLQRQAEQKIRGRAMEYQQDETDLSLRLTQQDAASRLSIKTRLNNLALDAATNKRLRDQLAAMDASEAEQINALRQRDAKALSAYQQQVRAQTDAQIHAQIGKIQAQTQAQIAARRDQVGAQLRSAAPPSLPANIPPAVRAQIAAIHRQYGQQFAADAQKTVDTFNATKADLTNQFQALHGADVGATGVAAAELATLQKRHDQLTGQMADQLKTEAARLAKQRGFSVALVGVKAAPGGYDLTNDLIKDIESLHE